MVNPVETVKPLPRTIARYSSRFPHLSPTFVDEVVHEFYTWIGLHAESGNAQENTRLWITGELRWLDEFWHDCLKEPEEYEALCRKILGQPLQHIEFNSNQDPALSREDFARVLRELGNRLGAEKLRKWYIDYPKIFTLPS